MSKQAVIIYNTVTNHVDGIITADSDTELATHVNSHFIPAPNQSTFTVLRSDLQVKGKDQLLANFTQSPVVTKSGKIMPVTAVI